MCQKFFFMSQIPSNATYKLHLIIERKVDETAKQRIPIRFKTLIETSFLLKFHHINFQFL